MMQDQKKPIIAICGATGGQGGSVARILLDHGHFSVRALTRRPDHQLAISLENHGAEVVRADFEEPESLLEALQGVYGVFAITDYMEVQERTYQQGRNLVDAASRNGVKHLIWSSFEHIRNKPEDFVDGKGSVSDYLRQSDVPCTYFYPAIFYSTLFNLQYFTIKAGIWYCNFPCPSDASFPLISTEDVGGWVLQAFLHPDEWIGKELKPCTEHISARQSVAVLEELTGQPVILKEVSNEEYFAQEAEYHIDDHLQRITRWFLENETFYDIALGRAMYPAAQRWREYVSERLDALIDSVPVNLSVDVSTTVHVTPN